MAGLTSVSAFSADLGELPRLLRTGKHAEAMKLVEAGLKSDPQDPQLRFAKGVVLMDQKRTQDAIDVFLKLSQDFPDLPEPYNNLAVLYSRDNQFEKARAALNMAIKTNPSYATAHENLGDIHARMAAQSYGKAMNLNGQSVVAQSKLKVLTALALPAPRETAVVAVSTKPQTPAPPQKTIPAPAPKADLKAGTPAVVAAAPMPAASPEVPPPLAMAERAGDTAIHDEILRAVNAWAEAWAGKDMDAYIAAYESDFHGNGAKNHAAWVALRKARILGKDSIDIKIERPNVELEGDTAVVSFRQRYVGGHVKSDGLKTLTLKKKSGKWKITKEVAAT